MKRTILIFSLLILIIFLIACDRSSNSSSQNIKSTASPAPSTSPNAKPVSSSVNEDRIINLTLATEPAVVEANHPTKLTFGVQNGVARLASTKDFEVVHEKPMHLMIISDDLSFFAHEHPHADINGLFNHTFTFPAAGKYHLYLDYTPASTGHQLGHMLLNVVGEPIIPNMPLNVDENLTKTINGARVTMKPEKPFKTNDPVEINFYLEDEKTGKPINDLDPYLGAYAHFVIIDEQHTEFLHAHPMEHGTPMPHAGGPIVGTHTIFPKPGKYKLWAQFLHGDKMIIASFVVDVAQGTPQAPAQLAKTDAGVQKIRVVVSEKGYEPANLELKKDVPTQITFYRANENNCGTEVVSLDLGIRKELPVGKEVVVDLTPDKSGSFDFTCGMGMLRGKILIK